MVRQKECMEGGQRKSSREEVGVGVYKMSLEIGSFLEQNKVRKGLNMEYNEVVGVGSRDTGSEVGLVFL